jgi:hypothetical protein
MNEQKAIDKCIQQLVDRAARNTVLRAKKIVLQFVCRDYCQLSREVLNNLRNKEELYAAATAWVRVQCVASNCSISFLPRYKQISLKRIPARRGNLPLVVVRYLARTLWRPFGQTWSLPNFRLGLRKLLQIGALRHGANSVQTTGELSVPSTSLSP